MEYLHNGFTLELCEDAFPLSTDSIALSGFAILPRQAKVLDLGSGCGTLGLLLCASDPGCTVTGIELNENAHHMALHNITTNNLGSRLASICADLRTVPSFLTAGSFHCCVSNPPYFSAGQKSANSCARHELSCSLDELFSAASWAVHYGGDFFLVHKPDRLSELCVSAVKHGFEPKRLQFLRHHPGENISLILLQCRKGAKPGLIIEEKYLKESNGQPSDYYRKLYHI